MYKVLYIPLRSDKTEFTLPITSETVNFTSHYVQIKLFVTYQPLFVSAAFTSHYVQIKHLRQPHYQRIDEQLYIPLRSDKTIQGR